MHHITWRSSVIITTVDTPSICTQPYHSRIPLNREHDYNKVEEDKRREYTTKSMRMVWERWIQKATREALIED